jgi:hypothetical protein
MSPHGLPVKRITFDAKKTVPNFVPTPDQRTSQTVAVGREGNRPY